MDNFNYGTLHDFALQKMSKYKIPKKRIKLEDVINKIEKNSKKGKHKIKISRKQIKYKTLKTLDLKGFNIRLKRNKIEISW